MERGYESLSSDNEEGDGLEAAFGDEEAQPPRKVPQCCTKLTLAVHLHQDEQEKVAKGAIVLFKNTCCYFLKTFQE